MDPAQESGGKTKVLGIIWDNNKGILEFDLMKMATNSKESRPTKRGVLSTLAMSFDPLGLISPIGVHAKTLFQDLCREKLDWDDPIVYLYEPRGRLRSMISPISRSISKLLLSSISVLQELTFKAA